MTTSPVMTVTDELLAELDRSVRVVWHDDDATVIAVDALTAELLRLRAENAELAQSLAESRANDQAAMGWLTSLRWASGDRGERMLPELVTHIESLAKDAGRYRWTLHQAWFQSAFERYDPEDDGTQALFELECRKITDIAMYK